MHATKTLIHLLSDEKPKDSPVYPAIHSHINGLIVRIAVLFAVCLLIPYSFSRAQVSKFEAPGQTACAGNKELPSSAPVDAKQRVGRGLGGFIWSGVF